jgi:hypothetical protein
MIGKRLIIISGYPGSKMGAITNIPNLPINLQYYYTGLMGKRAENREGGLKRNA